MSEDKLHGPYMDWPYIQAFVTDIGRYTQTKHYEPLSNHAFKAKGTKSDCICDYNISVKQVNNVNIKCKDSVMEIKTTQNANNNIR